MVDSSDWRFRRPLFPSGIGRDRAYSVYLQGTLQGTLQDTPARNSAGYLAGSLQLPSWVAKTGVKCGGG